MDHRTAAYQRELGKTSQAVSARIEKVWRSLPDYRDANRALFLDNALPIIQAGQERAVSLTSAYLSNLIGQHSPVPLPYQLLTGAGVRNGMDPREVYSRPFTTLYTSIEKLGYSAAIEKALARLTSTADMDVAMSARDASVAFAQTTQVIRAWKRVAAPDCCAFCDDIDGALVHSDEPAPLHNLCRCTVEPATDEDIESGTFINMSDVMGDTQIREHGEMGPYIANADDHWTPVGDSSKWDKYREDAERFKASDEEAYQKWLDNLDPGRRDFYAMPDEQFNAAYRP